jgi:hypothetical protein
VGVRGGRHVRLTILPPSVRHDDLEIVVSQLHGPPRPSARIPLSFLSVLQPLRYVILLLLEYPTTCSVLTTLPTHNVYVCVCVYTHTHTQAQKPTFIVSKKKHYFKPVYFSLLLGEQTALCCLMQINALFPGKSTSATQQNVTVYSSMCTRIRTQN